MSMVQCYDQAEEVGFRFDPSDEELILFYLRPKVAKEPNQALILQDNDDIYKKEPWRLDHTDTHDFFQPNEWFYFVNRTQLSDKATGTRSHRKVNGDTCGGCWRATGKSLSDILSEETGEVIGKKRSLSFYVKNENKATGWTMTEYYLAGDSFQNQVLCRLKFKPSYHNDYFNPNYELSCLYMESN